MNADPNRFELIGYLEEALAPEDMVRVEERLRTDSDWRAALRELRDELDLGEHSVATIWRRHRLTCSTRERLGAYLLGALDPREHEYIEFHLQVIKCRWCAANLADLQTAQPVAGGDQETGQRRRRMFQSSVGLLPRKRS